MVGVGPSPTSECGAREQMTNAVLLRLDASKPQEAVSQHHGPEPFTEAASTQASISYLETKPLLRQHDTGANTRARHRCYRF